MSKYKALTNFCGTPVSMKTGEIREIADKSVAADLIRAGYIEQMEIETKNPAEAAEKLPEKEPAKPAKKTAKGRKNEA